MSRDNSYYIGLITSQYQNSQKFLSWVEANISMLAESSSLVDDFIDYFDIDSAIGAQLDIIGEIVGQGRQVNFEPTGGSGPILDDRDYRVLLKAKVAKNMWDGKQDSLQEIWQALFPGAAIIIKDNQNMTANIFLTGSYSYNVKELIRNGYIVPRPEGVLYNYYFGGVPLFGFGLNNGYIAGFGKGYWAHRSDLLPKFGFGRNDEYVSGFGTGRWTD